MIVINHGRKAIKISKFNEDSTPLMSIRVQGSRVLNFQVKLLKYNKAQFFLHQAYRGNSKDWMSTRTYPERSATHHRVRY